MKNPKCLSPTSGHCFQPGFICIFTHCITADSTSFDCLFLLHTDGLQEIISWKLWLGVSIHNSKFGKPWDKNTQPIHQLSWQIFHSSFQGAYMKYVKYLKTWYDHLLPHHLHSKITIWQCTILTDNVPLNKQI